MNKNNFTEEKLNYLRLANTNGIGQVLFFRLLNKYKDPEKVLEFLQEERKIEPFSKIEAEKEFEKAEKLNIQMLFFCDKEYPYLLKQIYDVPPILYVKGNVEVLNKKSVAVIGSRNASINSKHFTQIISRQLVDNDFCKALINKLGRPITSTSANLAGDKAPSIYVEITEQIKSSVDYVVQLYHDVLTKPKASTIIRLYEDNHFDIIRQ